MFTNSFSKHSVVMVSYLQTPMKWKTFPLKELQCGSPEHLQFIVPQHLTFGSPVLPAGHLQVTSPFLLLHSAPVPHGFGSALQISLLKKKNLI